MCKYGGNKMQTNSHVMQKAKWYVKRYVICCTVFAFCVVLGFGAVAFSGNTIATVLALVVCLLLISIGSPILFNKCILSILNKKLDADTYLATVYQGNFDTPAAFWQLNGEYYCGHYQNTVSICKIKLADPKIAKRSTYLYLVLLANVYFDIEDDESLQKVCRQYEALLAKEKPSKQARLRARFSRMTFYGYYLTKNIDACMAWVNAPTTVKLNQYHRTLCKARLALMQESREEANRYYEALAKEVPGLNYGKIAAWKLAEQNNQPLDDSWQAFNISDEPQEVALYPANRRKVRRILTVCLIALGLLYVAAGILRVLDSQNRYEESIRILVEQDYDGVEVLDTFTLKNGKDVIDTMFICKTDKDIIVGCTYVYEGDPTQYYKKMIDISIASLSEERSPLWYCSFPSETTHNQIESYFYTVKADVPTGYVHLSTFEINGQKVYYVITEIVPGITVTLSDP